MCTHRQGLDPSVDRWLAGADEIVWCGSRCPGGTKTLSWSGPWVTAMCASMAMCVYVANVETAGAFERPLSFSLCPMNIAWIAKRKLHGNYRQWVHSFLRAFNCLPLEKIIRTIGKNQFYRHKLKSIKARLLASPLDILFRPLFYILFQAKKMRLQARLFRGEGIFDAWKSSNLFKATTKMFDQKPSKVAVSKLAELWQQSELLLIEQRGSRRGAVATQNFGVRERPKAACSISSRHIVEHSKREG